MIMKLIKRKSCVIEDQFQDNKAFQKKQNQLFFNTIRDNGGQTLSYWWVFVHGFHILWMNTLIDVFFWQYCPSQWELNNTFWIAMHTVPMQLRNGVYRVSIRRPLWLWNGESTQVFNISPALFNLSDCPITDLGMTSSFGPLLPASCRLMRVRINYALPDGKQHVIAPQKSSVTLFTSDTHQSWLHPQVQIGDEVASLKRTPKILGIMLDTHFTFGLHARDCVTIFEGT